MLSANIQQQLKKLQIDATHLSEFISGFNLTKLVIAIFYNGRCPQLESKIRISQVQKTGNDVLNINMLLNYLKKDQQIYSKMTNSIKDLTAFKIIEDQHSLLLFITWLLSESSINTQQKPAPTDFIHQKEDSKMQYQQKDHPNQFENLYFVADMIEISPPKPLQDKQPLNDSLEIEPSTEKIRKKGSFKIIKPKLISDKQNQQPEILVDHQQKTANQLKQLSMIYDAENNLLQNEDNMKNTEKLEEKQKEDDFQFRKTIPKMMQKPPLYKSRHKQNKQPSNFNTNNSSQKSVEKPRLSLKQQIQVYNHSPYLNLEQNSCVRTQYSSAKREEIRNSISKIQQEISIQQASILHSEFSDVKNTTNLPSQTNKSSRKIFKIEIAKVAECQKRKLLEWLIEMNLINSLKISSLEDIHETFKNGVIFIEILSFYRGRRAEVSYFKDPKRSAEMHSNYQKLFSTLQLLPHFSSPLLFLYQYFLPILQEKAFWSLLESMYFCYKKKFQEAKRIINDHENLIHRKVERIESQSNSIKSQKDSNSKQQKSNIKMLSNAFSSLELKSMKQSNVKMAAKQFTSKPSTKLSTFYPQLIQNEDPNQDLVDHKTEKGYKDIYQEKYKHIQTPTKKNNLNQYDSSKNLKNSINKSKSRLNSHPAKKSESRFEMPSINLEMQMKVLKYLQDRVHNFQQMQENDFELFKDPFRNGLLLKMVIAIEFENQKEISLFVKIPKGIEDCRHNIKLGLKIIKKNVSSQLNAYDYYSEDIIKGEKSLIFGIIWHVLANKNQPELNGYHEKKSSFYRIQSNEKQKHLIQNHSESDDLIEQTLLWIRSLEQSCQQISDLKIRDAMQLITSIENSKLLYAFCAFITTKRSITPTYQNPITLIQKESNIKKVLNCLIQNKILRSDYLWKTKAIAKKDMTVLHQLLRDLMKYCASSLRKEEAQVVTFVKYLRKDQPNSLENQHFERKVERLDTTMANQVSNIQVNATTDQRKLEADHEASMPLEIEWMRRLGFHGDLSLNNGVILCQLISRLTMKTIVGICEQPHSKAECLSNIRRAIKQIPKFVWDEYDIFESEKTVNLQIYNFLREKYKHAYAMKFI